jgi:predicted SnoaL-like aldol condensation-catalyzing enzyme
MAEDNKSIIRRLYREALDAGDLDSVDRFYAEDAEVHIPGVPEDPFGPGPIRQLFATVRRAFPGVKSVIEDLIAEGDRVVARVSFRVPSGEGQAVPPQTRLAMWQRVDVFRLFDGRVVEHWADRDDVSTLLAFGILPPPERTEGRTLPTGGTSVL